jgi:hypothetical protein
MSMKNSNDNIGNRIHDLMAYSAVPQPTAPTRAPTNNTASAKFMRHGRYKNVQTIAKPGKCLQFSNLLGNN